jgi:hypothetical protein
MAASTAQARIRILNCAAAAALLTATLSIARAAVSEEPFDYIPGTALAAGEGGSGWTSAWIDLPAGAGGMMLTEDGSLTYPGLVSSGGKMHFTDTSGLTTATVTYRTNAVSFTNGVVYARCLAQRLNNELRYFGLSFFNGKTERMLLGQGSGFSTWTLNHVVITNALGTNTLVSSVSSTSVSLLVLKLQLQDGNDRATFWVNPDVTLPEDETTAVGGTNYLMDLDVGQITRVRVGGGAYSSSLGVYPAEHYMDEISISSESPFPLPPPTLTCSAASGMLTVSWSPLYLGWTLQAQTNALSTGITTWTGTDIPGTDLVTSTNIPISLDSPLVFFRLRQ